MKYILMPKFGVIDYWNRYEWHGRGSPHSYRIVWLKTDDRGIPICDMTFQENREYFARF